MGRRFDGTNDTIELGDTPFDFIETDAFTVLWWVEDTETAVNAALMSKLGVSSPFTGWEMITSSVQGADDMNCQLIKDASNKLREDSIGMSRNDGNTHHIGVTKGTGTTSSALAWFNNGSALSTQVVNNTLSVGENIQNNEQMTMGERPDGSQDYEGDEAEVCVWAAELSTNEVLILSRGVNPFIVQNSNINGYWPLYGNDSPEPQYKGQTDTGTVTGATKSTGWHPPVEQLENFL